MIAFSLALSLSLFLPVQLIASAITSLNMGQVGYAYLALLVLGGLFLLGLLFLSSIVLRAIGWLGLCRVEKTYCVQLLVVVMGEPVVLLSSLVQLLTFNGNLSFNIAAMWLFLLVEVMGAYMVLSPILPPERLQRLSLLASLLGFTFSSTIVVVAAASRSILASLLTHLAASSIASLSLVVLGVLLIFSTSTPRAWENSVGVTAARGE